MVPVCPTRAALNGRRLGRDAQSSSADVIPVHELLIASALLLVVEGVWPFLSPATFRRVLMAVAAEGDGPLRLTGLISMLAGVALLYLVN